jgi:hypothetical protein
MFNNSNSLRRPGRASKPLLSLRQRDPHIGDRFLWSEGAVGDIGTPPSSRSLFCDGIFLMATLEVS